MNTTRPTQLAIIDEALCIGCTKCIQACPVDAIAGAAKQMHTVIAEECIGCELCLPPCPMDCIQLIASAPLSETARQQRRKHTQNRIKARKQRLNLRADFAEQQQAMTHKKAYIASALARVRDRKSNKP